MSDLLTVQSLSFQLGDFLVLQDVSFVIPDKKIVTVIGPNGAGKTTLLKLILGLYKPLRGTIEKKDDLKIGYVPQKINLNPLLPITVHAFLKLQTKDGYCPSGLLDELDISKLEKKSLFHLSGGQLQRVLITAALLQRPNLLILDEPAQGIDVTGEIALYTLLTHLRDIHGCSILMVSHDLHAVMSTSDQVLCLNRHICCQGHPEYIQESLAFKTLFPTHMVSFYQHHHDHTHDPLHSKDCAHDKVT